jgi:hypothetical protein
MLLTLVCLSRIRVCSKFAPAVPDLSARVLTSRIIVRGLSKLIYYLPATGWRDNINYIPSWDIYVNVASRWDY